MLDYNRNRFIQEIHQRGLVQKAKAFGSSWQDGYIAEDGDGRIFIYNVEICVKGGVWFYSGKPQCHARFHRLTNQVASDLWRDHCLPVRALFQPAPDLNAEQQDFLKTLNASGPVKKAKDFLRSWQGNLWFALDEDGDIYLYNSMPETASDQWVCQFESRIVGGAIPREFIPAVEAGVREAAQTGPVAGFECVDLRVILLDGRCHEKDSSALAFELAGTDAFREAVRQAAPVLLEPVMAVEVVTPADGIGACIGDLHRRRGQVSRQEQRGERTVIEARVPLKELFGYIGDLRPDIRPCQLHDAVRSLPGDAGSTCRRPC